LQLARRKGRLQQLFDLLCNCSRHGHDLGVPLSLVHAHSRKCEAEQISWALRRKRNDVPKAGLQ
jgi:hypothetical protein